MPQTKQSTAQKNRTIGKGFQFVINELDYLPNIYDGVTKMYSQTTVQRCMNLPKFANAQKRTEAFCWAVQSLQHVEEIYGRPTSVTDDPLTDHKYDDIYALANKVCKNVPFDEKTICK